MSYIFFQTDRLGRKFLATIEYALNVFLLAYFSLRATIFDQTQGLRTVLNIVAAQIYYTGVQAIPLVSVLALATGSIVVMQGSLQLNYIGGSEMIGNLIVVVIIRELGPLVTSLIVIARSGTAVASELGNMRVNREIEALNLMGIDPLSYIVFPRILGGVISVLSLAFYFSVISVLGGFLVSAFFYDRSVGFFLASVAQAIAVEDVYLFFIKNGVSGWIIFAVCSFQGLQVKQSPHEVPQMTTLAVMNSIIAVVGFNLFMTGLYYINQLKAYGVI